MNEHSSDLLLSVIVPTRHRLDTLAACLAALAPGAQTLAAARYEVIITDDGTQPTAETLVREQFPWARWTAGPRRGPASNRNHGARQAHGAWLVFTDDDCQPDPDWLLGYAREIDAGEPVAVLEGRTSSGVAHYGPLLTAPDNEEGGFLWSCNFAVTRELFGRLGGFDEGFKYPHLEDVDFRLRLGDAGEQIRFAPAALVVHPPRPIIPVTRRVRMHESSFYLARKRGMTLKELNLRPGVIARTVAKNLLACRAPGEFLQVAWNNTVETILLACYLPVWLWRYRKKAAAPLPTPTAAAAPPRA